MSKNHPQAPVAPNVAAGIPMEKAIQQVRPTTRPESPPVSNDLAHGQTVIITARWIMVLAGLLLAMWIPSADLGQLRLQILVLLLLAGANFYLQAQLLTRRPVLKNIVYAASAGDLFLITLLIITQGGLDSSLYIFYFPAILAFSVAFPSVLTFFYVSVTMILYAAIGLVSSGLGSDALQLLLVRLVMLAAVGFCGNQYLRIERDRRQVAARAELELRAQIRQRQVGTEPAD